AGLLRLAPREHVLILTLHHIITDGWSNQILQEDLFELYAAAVEDRPAQLDPLPIQYADFAAWQRGAMQEEALATQLEYWKKKLADPAPPLDLPSDHARPPMPTFRGAR